MTLSSFNGAEPEDDLNTVHSATQQCNSTHTQPSSQQGGGVKLHQPYIRLSVEKIWKVKRQKASGSCFNIVILGATWRHCRVRPSKEIFIFANVVKHKANNKAGTNKVATGQNSSKRSATRVSKCTGLEWNIATVNCAFRHVATVDFAPRLEGWMRDTPYI